MIDKKNQKLATICLMWGMFFLPFGYDALFKMIMDLTGSYWITDFAFYSLSGVLFGFYFYFAKRNPIIIIKGIIKDTFNKIIKKNQNG